MKIVVIIVNYRTPDLVIGCLQSLAGERRRLPDLSVVVVDNASGDNSVPLLEKRLCEAEFSSWVEFLPQRINGGFGWGNNQAIQKVLQADPGPDAVLLLNPDARIEEGAIEALVQELQRNPDAASIGSQLVNEDGSLSGSAFRFPSIGREWIRGHGLGALSRLLRISPTLVPIGFSGSVDWVTGASVLMRAAALREVGLFDTGFFLYFEEVELMHRFRRQGWKNLHCAKSRVVHLAGSSTGIIDGKSAGKSAPPDYVFQARRRYFALTKGRLYAALAGMAWLTGDLIARLVALVFPGKPSRVVEGERAAFLRIGLLAESRDAVPAISRWDDRPGQPPAWME